MANVETREGYEWWDQFCKLPRYNFFKNDKGAIVKWENSAGTWIEQYAAGELVDEMQAEINRLTAEVAALKQRQAMKAV